MLKKITIVLLSLLLVVPFLTFSTSAAVYDDYVVSTCNVASTNYSFRSAVVDDYVGKVYYYYPDIEVLDLQYNFSLSDYFVTGDVFSLHIELIVPLTYRVCQAMFGGVTLSSWSQTQTVDSGGNSVYLLSGNISGKVTSAFSSSLVIMLRLNSMPQSQKLGVKNITYVKNNDPSISANAAANAGADKITGEDYGYSEPETNETDSGIAAGTNLLESITDSLDNFNASLNEDTTKILDDLKPFKDFVDQVFGFLPDIVLYLVTFAVMFVVIRKVVGR